LLILSRTMGKICAEEHANPRATNQDAGKEADRLHASLSSFITWVRRRFDLFDLLGRVPDGRDPRKTRIPLSAILLAVMAMFWLGLPSLRALDDRLKRSSALQRLLALVGWPASISDDSFAEALERLGMEGLRQAFYRIAKREIKRWRAGRFRKCALARRLKEIIPRGSSGLVSRLLVAIDGHELFCTERRSCKRCLTRKVKRKIGNQIVEVEERYHRIVSAQWIGTHPAIVLDFEEFEPGENELYPAYRLVERLSSVYGYDIGILVADALFDNEPFRHLARTAGYRTVIRQKDPNRKLAILCQHNIDYRDSDRQSPDSRHLDPYTKKKYECWVELAWPGCKGERYIEVRRTSPTPKGQKETINLGAIVTDLHFDEAPAVAVAMLMEARWEIGASSQGRITQGVQVPPRPRDSRPRSLEGAVA